MGRVIRELSRQDGQPGDSRLTIDRDLQTAPTSQAGEKAAAVVMDIHNGDVLVLSSVPGFDPMNS